MLFSKNAVQRNWALKDISIYFSDYQYGAKSEKIIEIAFKLREGIEDFPMQKLQNKAREYFSHKFSIINIEFFPKKDGVQLGNRILVKLSDEEHKERDIVYFAKTHRGGARREESSGTQRVDLKELLVYKILQLSGFGPEFHFFYDDIKDFYIATKDAGYDDNTMTRKEFVTYETLKTKIDLEELALNEIIVESVITADILSRVLLLSDFLNNSANMGWILEEDNILSSFKIIDFISHWAYYSNSQIYEHWLSGSSSFCYSDQGVRSIIMKDKEVKIAEAKQIIRKFDCFPEWVNQAHQFIIDGLASLTISNEQLKNLEVYEKIIQEHFKTFYNRLLSV
jgi:hypothetical protein